MLPITCPDNSIPQAPATETRRRAWLRTNCEGTVIPVTVVTAPDGTVYYEDCNGVVVTGTLTNEPEMVYVVSPDASAASFDEIITILEDIRDQPRVEFESSIWVDANGLTFVRQETRDEVTGAITVAYVDAGGNTVTPVAPFLPFASGDRELVKHCYTAIADDAGNQYSIGDKIIRINVIDPITGGTFQAFWFNETTGFYIAEPLQADLEVCVADGSQIIETPQVWGDIFAVEFQVYSREVTSYDAGYSTTAIEYSTDGINWGTLVPPTLPFGISTPVNFVRLGYLSEKATIDYLINRTTNPTVYDAGVGVGHQANTSLAAGMYKAVQPTLLDGDQSELLLDQDGNLKVTVGDGATEPKQDAQIAIAQAQSDAIGSKTDLSVQNGNDGTVIALLKGISKSLYALFDRFVSKQIRIDSFQYAGTGSVSIPAGCTKIEIYIPDGAIVEVDGVAIPTQVETATISDDHGRELTIGSIAITTAGASPVFVLTYSF